MRVNIDDVDYDGGMTLYNGVPFTGEVVEVDGQGQVFYLATYDHGYEDGPFREWYGSGGRKTEGQVVLGRGPFGLWRTWHRNGQLASERVYADRGRLASSKEWAEDGTLTTDETYPDESTS